MNRFGRITLDGKTLSVFVSEYPNGVPALLLREPNGMPYAKPTVNPSSEMVGCLQANETVIADYGCHDAGPVVAALEESELAEDTGKVLQTYGPVIRLRE